jgi:two-component system CheB/CheR fusion protein
MVLRRAMSGPRSSPVSVVLTALTAHDGPSAREAARTYRPEVVLLDNGVPGMSGYEVARRM